MVRLREISGLGHIETPNAFQAVISNTQSAAPGYKWTAASAVRGSLACHITLRITGRQMQSEARAVLFAVPVNAIVSFIFGLASLLTLTPQANRQYQEKGKPLQSTVPPPLNPPQL
jgi:hypothetical protein